MVAYVIPPAGTSAAAFFVEPPDPGPISPPVILAEDIDEATGEVRSLTVGVHPVDAAVKEALRLTRGSGAAVQNDGQMFRTIRKVGPSTPRMLHDEASRALKPFVDRRDITIGQLLTESGTPYVGLDAGAVFIAYTNLRTGQQRRARVG